MEGSASCVCNRGVGRGFAQIKADKNQDTNDEEPGGQGYTEGSKEV